MRRAILVIGVMGAVVLGATGWAFSSSDVSSPETIRMVYVQMENRTFDEPPTSLGLGDTEVQTGRLMLGGSLAGRAGFTCTQHRGFDVCEGVGKLPGGQLSFSGISWYNSPKDKHVWAITGGTGSYDNARGTIHIKDMPPNRSRVTIEVLP